MLNDHINRWILKHRTVGIEYKNKDILENYVHIKYIFTKSTRHIESIFLWF